jgi:hypothetical protein
VTLAEIHTSRRDWLSMCLAAVPCAPPSESTIRFQDIPPAAIAIAPELGLTQDTWEDALAEQQRELAVRIEQGSAEHITYYVLQSTSFTRRLPIDPIRMAASHPSHAPTEVLARFDDFRKEADAPDERNRIIRSLWQQLEDRWSPERCFRHTMDFLSARRNADRHAVDRLYQERGLAVDTLPVQTAVLERVFGTVEKTLDSKPMLLIGPGLDLTRRENFKDNLPLKSYQADWLASRGPTECMDARPEVVEFLKSRGQCAFLGDVTRSTRGRLRYGAAFATNVLLYLSDRLLFLAFAVIAAALRPGGYLVHNDQRFAAKVFGESFGLPVIKFEAISLGTRARVEQMDRAVIHWKTLATKETR